MTPVVEFERVSRVYGRGDAEVRALDDVSFAIAPGEFLAIMGPSGCGKSTCLNLMGALDRPTSGEYRFRGVGVAGLAPDQRALLRRHYFGFVFQGFQLLPRHTAVENVELPLIYHQVGRAERRRRALAALDAVGLAERATHLPSEMSGGQQQRTAIARALVTEPSLILADEPTGNLDSAKKTEILTLLRDLNRTRGITIVIVTHEPEGASAVDRVLRFKDGRLEADERMAA